MCKKFLIWWAIPITPNRSFAFYFQLYVAAAVFSDSLGPILFASHAICHLLTPVNHFVCHALRFSRISVVIVAITSITLVKDQIDNQFNERLEWKNLVENWALRLISTQTQRFTMLHSYNIILMWWQVHDFTHFVEEAKKKMEEKMPLYSRWQVLWTVMQIFFHNRPHIGCIFESRSDKYVIKLNLQFVLELLLWITIWDATRVYGREIFSHSASTS